MANKTVDEFAEIMQVTATSVRRWIADGMPTVKRGGPGRGKRTAIDLEAAVRWYFHEHVDHDKLDAQRERARRDKESADKLALENARTRGELASIAEIAEWYGGHVDRCTTRLEQVPESLGQMCEARIAAIVVPECRRLIREACEEIAAGSMEAART